MAERSHLSIGEVLSLLREEFPDVTISKIRFLESQGLVDPERTPSGYRKFYDRDVERLRWILRQQRENFLPLKVIRGRLSEGVEPPDGPADGPAAAHTPLDLTESAGPVPQVEGSPAAGDPNDGGYDPDHRRALRELAEQAAASIGPAPAPVAVPPRRRFAVPGISKPTVDRGARGGVRPGPPAVAEPAPEAPSGDRRLATPPVRAASPAPARSNRAVPDAPPPAPANPTYSTPTAPTGSTGPAESPMRPRPATPALFTETKSGRDAEPRPSRSLSAPAVSAPALSAPPATGPAAPVRKVAPSPPPVVAGGRGPTTGAGSPSSPRVPTTQIRPTRPVPAPVRPQPAQMGAAGPWRSDDGETYTAAELAAEVGSTSRLIAELEQYGLIATHAIVAGTPYFDSNALQVVRAAASLAEHGVEVRHLRVWRNAVDRETDLFQQLVLPLLRQRNPQSRLQAAETLSDLARLGGELRAALIERSINNIR